jgi:hypothetical protein
VPPGVVLVRLPSRRAGTHNRQLSARRRDEQGGLAVRAPACIGARGIKARAISECRWRTQLAGGFPSWRLANIRARGKQIRTIPTHRVACHEQGGASVAARYAHRRPHPAGLNQFM